MAQRKKNIENCRAKKVWGNENFQHVRLNSVTFVDSKLLWRYISKNILNNKVINLIIVYIIKSYRIYQMKYF